MNDTNKVTFGLKNIHIALMKDSFDQGKPLYEEPVMVRGAVNLNITPESSESPFYADDILYFNGRSDNGFKGDLEMAKFPDDLLVKILGWEYDQYGGVLEITNGKNRGFALGAELAGDEMGRRFWYYNCTGTRPNQSYGTLGGAQEVKTQTMSLTIIPMDLGNGIVLNKYAIANGGKGKELYNKFFEKVYIPSATEILKTNSKAQKVQ